MCAAMTPTTTTELDQMVAELLAEKDRFARQSIDERIQMLRKLRVSFRPVTTRWVEGAQKAKGIPLGTAGEAEDWLAGPLLIQRNLRLLEEALMYFKDNGKAYLPSGDAVRPWVNNRVVVDVFPPPGYDKLLFTGFKGTVVMQDDVTIDNLRDNMMWEYTRHVSDTREGKVALVLELGLQRYRPTL